MAHAKLLENCRSYFQRAQNSWDSYFSKWEAMAFEEEKEAGGESEGGEVAVNCKSEMHAPLKHRNKAIRARRSKRRDRMGPLKKLKDGRKRVHSKTPDRKRKGGIIHKTENQTNLECGAVNNKHFEADLKAIFIEILSENTNRMGMFSVLSRMFSRGAISNLSLSSMIMEKNEFSISPVGKTILNSCNGFRGRVPSPGIVFDKGIAPERGDAARRFGIEAASRSHTESHSLCLVPRPDCLLPPGSEIERSNGDKRTRAIRFSDSIHRDSLIPQERAPDNALTVLNKGSPYTVSQQSNTSLRFNHRSPEAVLREISSHPMSSASDTGEIHKRTRFNLDFEGSKFRFEGSDEIRDKNNGNSNTSTARFLKIYCTPKRPRRSIKSEENETNKVTHDSDYGDDDDEFFRIFD